MYIARYLKAFALTGRQVCVRNYPGRCPGLGASALSGRAAFWSFWPFQGVLLLGLLGLQGVLLLGLLGFQPDLVAIIWTYDTPSFLLLTKEVVTGKYPSVVTKTLSHLSFNFY